MAVHSDLVKSGSVQWAVALACAALLASKFWLVYRLNINWDEFYFLHFVHAQGRGELTQGLQTAYTHLFAWLPRVPGDEIGQIRVARILMIALLGASALMVQRLASRWLGQPAAWIAALAFLSFWPSMKHGGSFRADSLLLPLQLASLLVLTHPRLDYRVRGAGAGILLGAAVAVTIKAVLLAPVVVALEFADFAQWRRGLRSLVWLGAATAVTAAVLLGLHLYLAAGIAAETAGETVRGAWLTAIIGTPWLPQLETLREQLLSDFLLWLSAWVGVVCALRRRLWPIAGCALSLLPILFYRNSFAYYYVVMWGPACITIGAAAQALQDYMSRRPQYRVLAVGLFAALLAAHGLRDLRRLSPPRQAQQVQLISAVHQIFPEPVAYIDHSGMIASFRKTNFFMSTWGIARYRDLGAPFMPEILQRDRPPLLISNRGELSPGTFRFQQILEPDQELIELYYQPYWGSIRIAGAQAELGKDRSGRLWLPFGGRYRLESKVAVLIDGRMLKPGDEIDVHGDQLDLKVEASKEAGMGNEEPNLVRLLWAAAKPPPKDPPLQGPYYDPL